MHPVGRALVLILATASLSAAADTPDPLAQARLLYNQRQFTAALNAAERARLVPARAGSADLIAARAYLERFRERAEPEDLTNARDRLRRLDPQRLVGREGLEFIVGLGETLYFEGEWGAAAEVFGPLLVRQVDVIPEARDAVLEWWATALDRLARGRPEVERTMIYRRIRDRMQDEVGSRPSSAVAAYWLSAAARGQGDLQAAWDAAQAGWVRAPMANGRGAALRADLDRLVLNGLVPGRARALAQPPEMLRMEWESFKQRWTE